MIIYAMAKTIANECQNLSEQFPHLITDLATVCFEALHKADPDETLTLLVYETHYFHARQVEASNSASAFLLPHFKQRIREIIKEIATFHPQRHRLEFTRQHYALVGWRSLFEDLYVIHWR